MEEKKVWWLEPKVFWKFWIAAVLGTLVGYILIIIRIEGILGN